MDKLESIDKLNYLCNIIGFVIGKKYTIRDFCKKWYEEKLFVKYTSPEEAFYDFFCDKTFDTYTMEIPEIPILATRHVNKFEGDIELSDNWKCIDCVNCKWCINCKNCVDCFNCVKCKNCNVCINCTDCKDNEYIYNCKHVYNSKFLTSASNRAYYEGTCDEKCNINCNSCVDCIGCINCSECVDCYFCNDCCNSRRMNLDLQGYITDNLSIKKIFKLITLLDRISMLSHRCNSCNDCNYLCDGFKENNITYEFDLTNKYIIDEFINVKVT